MALRALLAAPECMLGLGSNRGSGRASCAPSACGPAVCQPAGCSAMPPVGTTPGGRRPAAGGRAPLPSRLIGVAPIGSARLSGCAGVTGCCTEL